MAGVHAASLLYAPTPQPRVALTYNILATTTNVYIDITALPGYKPGLSDVVINLGSDTNRGITVYSTAPSVAAVTILGGSSADTCKVNNYIFVMGCGGDGGDGGGASGSPGGDGGPALRMYRDVLVNNDSSGTSNGILAGGGGGGAGGGSDSAATPNLFGAAGGGGGSGGGRGGAGLGTDGVIYPGGAGGQLPSIPGYTPDNRSSAGGGGGRVRSRNEAAESSPTSFTVTTSDAIKIVRARGTGGQTGGSGAGYSNMTGISSFTGFGVYPGTGDIFARNGFTDSSNPNYGTASGGGGGWGESGGYSGRGNIRPLASGGAGGGAIELRNNAVATYEGSSGSLFYLLGGVVVKP
jgi:hypothetical protein